MGWRNVWTSAGGLAAAAVVVIGTHAAHAGAASTLDEGREIAEARCSMCHAVGQTGASPHPEAPPFRTLQDRYDVRLLEEALAEGMITGHPDMPEVVLDVDQIESFLLYLESLGQ